MVVFSMLGLAACGPFSSTLRAAGSATETGPQQRFFGTQFGADDLYNFDVGGPDVQRVSFRFTAQYNSPLKSIRLYWTDNAQRPGYAAGNGGQIRIEVFADSGLPRSIPAGNALASMTFTPEWVDGVDPLGTPEGIWRLLTFSDPAALVRGRIYHLVFTNFAADAVNNYVGVDGLIAFGDETQPTLSPLELGILSESGDGWVESGRDFASQRPNTITPIISLTYADGNSQGNGYAELWDGKPRLASGSERIRQVLRPNSPVNGVSQVSLRVKRVTTGGPLLARLEDSAGRVLAAAEFPAQQFSTTEHRWVTQNFDRLTTLQAGQSYYLVVSSPNGSYSTFCLGDGQRYGFGSDSVFSDGHAEYDLGAGWLIWYGYAEVGDLAARNGDLQFYLATEPAIRTFLPLVLRK